MDKILRANVFFWGLMIIVMGQQSCSPDNKKANKVQSPTSPQTKITEIKEKPKTILFYGNSLTAGYGLNDEQSFPSLIQGYIDSLGLNVHVINGGLSGETTSGGKERIDWVLKQPLDVFVLELGGNDMLRGLDISTTKANLDTILSKVKRKYPKARIFLAEMRAAPNMGHEYTSTFRKIYLDLANEHNIRLIPFFLNGVAGNPEYLLADGKHPNAAGQKIVAKTIWKEIKRVLIK